jgi:queuine/archaeosine tRNA-ribosyltransferase
MEATTNAERIENFRCFSRDNNKSSSLHVKDGVTATICNKASSSLAVEVDEMSRRGKRLLQFALHCKDGAPPFLTPHLLETYFPPDSYPQLVWGINMSDSCVVPLYHEYDNQGESHDVTGPNAIATSIVSPKMSKRQQKKNAKKGGGKLESLSTKKTKISGYTFCGRPLDRFFMIPKSYETIVVPTWDLVDNVSTSSTDSSNISSALSASAVSTNKIGLYTAHGRQVMDPTLFLDVLHGLKTAASCVLLYDDTITSSKGATTEIPSSTSTRCKACTTVVERTCHLVDQQLTHLTSVDPQTNQDKQSEPITQPIGNKIKFWIPSIGGDDIKLRKQSISEALNRSKNQGVKEGHSMHGIALIGLHRFPNQFEELLDMCLQEIPTNIPIAIPMTVDWVQIFHCMRLGVDLIGSSLPATLAKNHKVLLLDFYGWRGRDGGEIQSEQWRNSENTTPLIDIQDVKYKNDSSPLLQGCLCYACKNHIRAYIHHLAIAKELLCEILLFVHNLHHILEWFQEFSKAIDVGMEKQFIEHIQKQC